MIDTNGALATREEFGSKEVTQITETSSSAAAAQAKALVESRYVMAMHRPRDIDQARVKLLQRCKSSRFADVAIYRKPIGRGIEGPSIRFAEEAIRCMGNITVETMTVYDDEEKRIVRVTVTDLEANIPYSKDITVSKTVERKGAKYAAGALGQRENSYGDTTYLVRATDDDIANKENALVSKAVRTLGLRLIPGDLVDEAIEMIYETRSAEIASDPDAARKKLIDAFASINVMPDALKDYLGHDVGTVTPAEVIELRSLFQAIRDGEANWNAALAQKQGRGDESAPDTPEGKAFDPAPIENAIADAASVVELANVSLLIEQAPDAEKSRLMDVYQSRKDELEGGE